MTHKIEGDVLYLAPSAQDEFNRQRAMRAIVFSSLCLLVAVTLRGRSRAAAG